MKANWKAIGLVAAAAALYYPSLKLYQYLMKKRAAAKKTQDDEHQLIKAFVPAYRGKHKPHHRSTRDGQKDA